ncbi:MAG: DUF4347 domain-containing protein, partial [Candidatus Thiodiazotropha sp. (ex Lucinoma borealis)]|nr:DUF4347 domain-containing protein [Candidatus Thiodiazotropha sp. (ex Lucinoma borealis)]
DLISQSGDERSFEIVLLDTDSGGIEQISETLSQYTDLDAVHLISHGSDGEIHLGDAIIDLDEVQHNGEAINAWGNAFSAEGDLLIYGCDLAATLEGERLVDSLAQLTGADVAASDDLTGHAKLGGDWDLEYATGVIETELALSTQAQAAYQGTLDITTGLQGHWTFDADATDSSGNSYDGFLNAGASIDTADPTDIVGEGKLSTNGLEGYVNLSSHVSNFSGLTEGTISAWVNLTASSTQSIFTISDSSGSASHVTLGVESGYLFFDVMENGTGLLISAESTATVNDGAWHHVAVTVDSGGNTLYIDGTAASVTHSAGTGSSTEFFDDVTSLDAMRIGMGWISSFGPPNPIWAFDGLIDDARVYDRALSGTDIAELAAFVGSNAAPTIINLGGDTLAYTEGDGAQVIEQGTDALVADTDSSDFDTGTLTVSFQAGSDSAEDRLGIQNEGTGAGQISVAGYGIGYGGTLIGSFTGGANGDPLVITFNSNADAAAISALTQNITYHNTDTDNPTTGARTVRYVLTDGDGGTSADYDTTVTVSAVNDAPTFNDGDGIVTTAVGSGTDEGYGVIVQPDGKILVTGSTHNGSDDDITLTRYNVDGTLDTGFGGGDGIVTTNLGSVFETGLSVALQADGKVLVTGNYYNGANIDIALLRYNSDGTLDTSFGGGDGIVTTGIGSNQDYGQSVTIQVDGKILVGGWTDNVIDSDFALLRYNSDGTLDASFGGGDGIVTTSISSSFDAGASVAVQADGKILVGGHSTNGTYDFALMRYNADGSLDTSFDIDGIVTTDVGSSLADFAYSLTVQPDGKILLTGQTDSQISLVRYNSDGSLDASFGGGDGKVTTGVGVLDAGYSVTVQSDGKILVAGESHNGSDYDFVLLRYDSTGTLDTTFGGGDGIVTTPIGPGYDSANSVVVQSDGKILVVGRSSNGSNNDIALLRYNADGTLDTSFDPVTTLDGTPSFTEGGAAVVLDADVVVSDTELDGLNGGSGNYDGASLTLVRNGGATAEDVFTFSDGNGITFNAGKLIKNSQIIGSFDTSTTAGQLVITFTDVNGETPTSADVDNILQQITYSNSSDTPPASAQIIWSFDDGNTGSQGTGGAQQAVGSTTVTITAVNDDPTNAGSLPGDISVTEDVASNVDISAIDINDVDAASGDLTVTLTTSTGGNLSATTAGGVTVGGSGSATLTLTGTQANLNTFLNTASNVTYLHGTVHTNGNDADTIQVTVNDGGNTGIGGGTNINFGTVNVDITAVDDVPVANTDSITVAEGGMATTLDGGFSTV